MKASDVAKIAEEISQELQVLLGTRKRVKLRRRERRQVREMIRRQLIEWLHVKLDERHHHLMDIIDKLRDAVADYMPVLQCQKDKWHSNRRSLFGEHDEIDHIMASIESEDR